MPCRPLSRDPLDFAGSAGFAGFGERLDGSRAVAAHLACRTWNRDLALKPPDADARKANTAKKVFHNDFRRRWQGIAQAGVRNAVCMAGSRS